MLDSIKPRPEKNKSKLRLWLSLILIILVGSGLVIGGKLIIYAQKIFEGEGKTFSFKKLFISADKELIGEAEGEIRVLLLGIGGEGHDGGTLTDTIILATLKVNPEIDQIVSIGLVSIPRDLAVNITGYDFRKVNTAYAFGESGEKKQGPSLAIETIEAVIGKSIPYYGVVDFEAFKKIIDDLGGIEVTVEEGFTDSLFPDERGGYIAPLIFEAGQQKMNGERALQYVRSRHGNNNQGSDFSRTKRQQLVLKAVKEKAVKYKTFTNLNLLNKILSDLSDHVRTNLAPHELKRLYSLTKDLDSSQIRTLAIDGESGLVCDQIVEENGAYLLIPCEGLGNYGRIRAAIHNQFLISSLREEQSTIEIQNASPLDSLAERVRSNLTLPSLNILTVNFHGQATYQQSIIYDNTKGKKPKTLKYLVEKIGLRVAQSPFPFQTTHENPDFVIIVTSDIETKIP